MELIVDNDTLNVTTADDLDRALAKVNPDAETMLVLFRSEEEYILAEGVPSVGLVVSYEDQAAGIHKIARDRALDLRTVTDIFHAFREGNRAWQRETQWEDAPEMPRAGCAVALVKLVLVAVISFSAFLAGSRLAQPLTDSLIFYPICESYQTDVATFERGVFAVLHEGVTEVGLCHFADGQIATVEELDPNAEQNAVDARSLEALAGMTVVIPVAIGTIFLLFRRRQTESTALIRRG